MITSLTGTITYHGVGFVVLEVQGVGYRIFLPENKAHRLSGEQMFYTHEVIRDNERELYGFFTMEALALFWKLIGVSGVGPRGAQKIIFADEMHFVKKNIMEGNLSFFTTVPGIGKKTAQKIILELKGTLVETSQGGGFDMDAVEALVGLGYRRREAEEVMSQVKAETTDDRIREALKRLSK